MIEKALAEHLRDKNIEPLINENKYKMKFSLTTKDQGDVTQINLIGVKICKVDDNNVNVQFSHLSGDKIRFLEHFSEFKSTVLKNMNDAI